MNTIAKAWKDTHYTPWDAIPLVAAYAGTPTVPWGQWETAGNHDLLLCMSDNIVTKDHKTGETKVKVGAFWSPNPYLVGAVRLAASVCGAAAVKVRRTGLKESDIGRLNWIVIENDNLSIEEQAEALDRLAADMGHPLALVVTSGDTRAPSLEAAGVPTAEKGKSLHAYLLLNSVSTDELDKWREASMLATLLIGGDVAMTRPGQPCRFPGRVVTHGDVTRVQTVLACDVTKRWGMDELLTTLHGVATSRGLVVADALTAMRAAEAFRRHNDEGRASRLFRTLSLTADDRAALEGLKVVDRNGETLPLDTPLWVEGRQTTAGEFALFLPICPEGDRGSWHDSSCPMHPNGTHPAGTSRWARGAVLRCRKYGTTHKIAVAQEVPMDAFDVVAESPNPAPKKAAKPPLAQRLAAHGYDDISSGKRMEADLRGKLARDRGVMLWYDGQTWEPNDEQARTEFLLAQERMVVETRTTLPSLKGDAREAAIKFLASISSTAGGRAVVAQAKDRLPQAPKVLDPDPWLLNTTAGEVDLKTGDLKPHDPTSWCSHVTPTSFDMGAAAPTWDRFMADVMPDADTRKFLQRFAGYCLTGDVSAQILVILYGQGANGKSVFTNVIQRVLGSYAATIDPEVLLGDYDGHKSPLMRLRGLRLAVASELRAGSRLNVSLLKRLTGGEPISANAMRQDTIEFLPSHKAMLVTNDRPVLRQTDQGDHGLWRRLRMVEFSRTFATNPEAGQGRLDPDMESKLLAESTGILAWAVRGLHELVSMGIAAGLQPSQRMEAAVTEYREDADLIKEFLDECTSASPGSWVKKRDLYDSYVLYCKTHNAHPMSMQTLTELLKTKRKLLVEKMNSRGTREWFGIRLQAPADGLAVRPVDVNHLLGEGLDLSGTIN